MDTARNSMAATPLAGCDLLACGTAAHLFDTLRAVRSQAAFSSFLSFFRASAFVVAGRITLPPAFVTDLMRTGASGRG